jgi:hypothetical protein
MGVGARADVVYHLVELISLANRNRYEVDSGFF